MKKIQSLHKYMHILTYNINTRPKVLYTLAKWISGENQYALWEENRSEGGNKALF